MKKVLLACVATAVIASAGVASSQYITIFHDHQTPDDRNPLPFIALQTQQDVRRDPQRLQQPWNNTLANFYRDNPSAGTVRAEAQVRGGVYAQYVPRQQRVPKAIAARKLQTQKVAHAVPVDEVVRTPVYMTR